MFVLLMDHGTSGYEKKLFCWLIVEQLNRDVLLEMVLCVCLTSVEFPFYKSFYVNQPDPWICLVPISLMYWM